MRIRILAVIESPLSDSNDPTQSMGLGLILNDLASRRIRTLKRVLRFDLETLLVSSQDKSEKLRERLKQRLPQQIWLFGCGDEDADPLPLAEDVVATIFALMKRGVGIFATGDHGMLGADLAGSIPRVRRMRFWRPDNFGVEHRPPDTEDHRIESICPPVFPHLDLKPDYDDTPKRVYFTPSWNRKGQQWNHSVHPLGLHPDLRRIGYLPDHSHEGECRVPTMAEMDGSVRAKQDFPKACRYQIAAYASRTGFSGDKRTHAEIYPAVSCFSAPKQGRIVVDSTFHHWVNGNIHAARSNRRSWAWKHIREYSANIATWLARRVRWVDIVRQDAYSLALYREVNDARRQFKADGNLRQLGLVLQSVQKATEIDIAPGVTDPATIATTFVNLLK